MVGWIILILLAVIVLVVFWLLLATIRLTIDSATGEFSIVWVGFFQGRLQFVEDKVYMKISAPFMQRRYDVGQKILDQMERPDKSVTKKGEKSRSRSSGRFISRKLKKNWLRIIKSFEVRRFEINVDTDDFVINSFLFPIAYFASLRGHQVGINYMGNQRLSLVIQNRLGKLFWAMFR